MCCTTHWLKCLHERVISSASSSTLCGCPFFDALFFTLFLSVCLSFFHLDIDLYLFLHVVDIRAISHWHYCQLKSLAPWSKAPLSQVMSPSSLTTSTTRILLKFSSGTSLTRNSTTIPSAERSFHSCSFRCEKNQRTADKFITLYEESLLPSQSFSVCHSRTETPMHELGSLSSCSREKPSRDSENERIRIF